MLPLQNFLARRFYERAADRINDPSRTPNGRTRTHGAQIRKLTSSNAENNARTENQATRNGARGQPVQVTSLLSRAQTRDIT